MDDRLKEILEGLNESWFAVIGDGMIDLSDNCIVRGVIKENPTVPLEDLKVIDSSETLGGATNVANNIVALGMHCDFYGVRGNDQASLRLQELCNHKGVNPRLVYEEGRKTPIKERFLVSSPDGRKRQRGARLTRNEENLKGINKRSEELIYKDFSSNINRYSAVILSDYNKGIFRGDGAGPLLLEKIIKLCNEREKPIIGDTKSCNLDYFKGCTVICPNRKEAHEMSGERYSDPEDLFMACNEIAKRMNPAPPRYIVVTCDEKGAFIYNDGNSRMIETRARSVEDVTGAGDSFTVGLAGALGGGSSIYEAVEFGNLIAGLAVENSGTTAVTNKEVMKYFEKS